MKALYDYLEPKTRYSLGLPVYRRWVDDKIIYVIGISFVNMKDVDLNYIKDNIGNYVIAREINTIKKPYCGEIIGYYEKERYMYIDE